MILGGYKSKPLLLITTLVLPLSLCSCGIVAWHSIEQTPAEAVAYMRDGVFVSGGYVRSALIAEIDGKEIIQSDNNLIQISLGTHQVNISCGEAEGEFNSEELNGKAKTLEFEAKMQRTYLVQCIPYTHWWIEDLENKAVVGGEKLD